MSKPMRLLIYIIVMLTFVGCNYSKETAGKEVSSLEMIYKGDIYYSDTLYLDFQEGFSHDSAVVVLNGRKVQTLSLYSDDVVGLADWMLFPIDSVEKIEISVFKKNNRKYFVLIDSIESNFLGVYYDSQNDRLMSSFRNEPFRYE